MKRILPALVLLCALLLCACSNAAEEPTPTVTPEFPAVTPLAHMNGTGTEAAESEETPTPAATDAVVDIGTEPGETTAPAPEVTVGQTAAYAFMQKDGSITLYGAAEVKNTGEVPFVMTDAVFTFTSGGNTLVHEFVPALSQYDVISPGETGYAVLYLENAELSAEGTVSLSAEAAVESTELTPVPMEATDVVLVKNYPGFATVTGTLTLKIDAECALNMAYLGFYDENNVLLGVWNFTKSAVFEGKGDWKNFTEHLRALPIDGLAENTASVTSHAFGFH